MIFWKPACILKYYFGFSLFGRPLKHFSQRGDFKLLMEPTLKRRILICMRDFKGLSPSTTPFALSKIPWNFEKNISNRKAKPNLRLFAG